MRFEGDRVFSIHDLIDRYVVGSVRTRAEARIQSARRECGDPIREGKDVFKLLTNPRVFGDFTRKLGLDGLYFMDAA